jgi:hypothetical protein
MRAYLLNQKQYRADDSSSQTLSGWNAFIKGNGSPEFLKSIMLTSIRANPRGALTFEVAQLLSPEDLYARCTESGYEKDTLHDLTQGRDNSLEQHPVIARILERIEALETSIHEKRADPRCDET